MDRRKYEARVVARKVIKGLLDRGDEVGFAAYVRILKPGVGDDEVQRLLKLFRDEYHAGRRSA
jgi:hypothetical protein